MSVTLEGYSITKTGRERGRATCTHAVCVREIAWIRARLKCISYGRITRIGDRSLRFAPCNRYELANREQRRALSLGSFCPGLVCSKAVTPHFVYSLVAITLDSGVEPELSLTRRFRPLLRFVTLCLPPFSIHSRCWRLRAPVARALRHFSLLRLAYGSRFVNNDIRPGVSRFTACLDVVLTLSERTDGRADYTDRWHFSSVAGCQSRRRSSRGGLTVETGDKRRCTRHKSIFHSPFASHSP